MQILLYFLLTLHVLVCLLMVLVVLMQRPRSEGLGAAFGSGMTDNIFGAQTTNVLAKFTTWLGGAFFVLTLALAMVYSHLYSGNTGMSNALSKLPAPAPVATPKPTGETLPAVPTTTPDTAASVSTPTTPTPTASPTASPTPANTAPNLPVEATGPSGN